MNGGRVGEWWRGRWMVEGEVNGGGGGEWWRGR